MSSMDEFSEIAEIVEGKSKTEEKQVAVAVEEPDEEVEDAPVCCEVKAPRHLRGDNDREKIATVPEEQVTTPGFMAMMSIFGEATSMIDFTEKELDALVEKCELWNGLAQIIQYDFSHAIPGDINFLYKNILTPTEDDEQTSGEGYIRLMTDAIKRSYFTNGKYSLDDVLNRFRRGATTYYGKYPVLMKPTIAPIVSLVLMHSTKYTVRVDFTVESGNRIRSKVNIKSNGVTKENIEKNTLSFRNVTDAVTIAGAQLLMEDAKGREVNPDRDLVDLYIQKLQNNDRDTIKKLDDVNTVILITSFNGAGKIEMSHNVVTIDDVMVQAVDRLSQGKLDNEIRDATQAAESIFINSSADKESQDRKDGLRAVVAELKLEKVKYERKIDLLIRLPYVRMKKRIDPLILKMMIPNYVSRCFSNVPISPDIAYTVSEMRKDYYNIVDALDSSRSTVVTLRDCIKTFRSILSKSVYADRIPLGEMDVIFASQKRARLFKDNASTQENAARAYLDYERRAYRIFLREFKKIAPESPVIDALIKHSKMGQGIHPDEVRKELNPKATPLLRHVLYQERSTNTYAIVPTVALYKMSEVTQIEREGHPGYRVVTLNPVNDLGMPSEMGPLRSFTLGVIEGTPSYDFTDEDRYCLALRDSTRSEEAGEFGGLLLIDNLGNFLRQTQLVLEGTAPGSKFYQYISRRDCQRGAATTFRGTDLTAPDDYNRSELLRVSAPNSSDLRKDIIGMKCLGDRKDAIRYANISTYILSMFRPKNGLCVNAFVGQDAQAVAFTHRNQNRPAAPGRRAIDYGPGANLEANAAAMNNSLVKSFWKGINRLAVKHKPFGLSPYGVAAQEVKFYPDRIEFEDQVLKSDNLMITPPAKLYAAVKELMVVLKDVSLNNFEFRELSEIANADDAPYALRQRAAKYNYETRQTNIDPVVLAALIKDHNTRIKEHNKRYKMLKKIFDRTKIVELLNSYKDVEILDEIADGVLRPTGCMFWPDRENIKKLGGVGMNDDIHQMYSIVRMFIRFMLHEEGLFVTRHDERSAVIDSLAMGYAEYRGLDEDGQGFMATDPIAEADDLDFNTLTDRFIDCICAPFALTKKANDVFKVYILPKLPLDQDITLCTATLGSVEAVVSVRVSGDRRTTKWMVNGKKLRRDEINPVLKRALCFEDQEGYDQFLADVQQVSLRARNLLTKGLELSLTNNDTDVPVLLEFSRSGRTWHLIVRNPDGTKYKVHPMVGGATKFANMLASSERARRLGGNTEKSMGVARFMEYMDNIPTLGIDSLKRLLATGLKTINEALARSRKLLEDTAKMVGAEWIEHTHGSKTITGYKVTGTSGNSYLICCDKVSTSYKDRHGHDKLGAVYSLPTLTYVCIVDKSNDQAGYDIVVNRLLALKNDTFVAGSVRTLSRYTDNN